MITKGTIVLQKRKKRKRRRRRRKMVIVIVIVTVTIVQEDIGVAAVAAVKAGREHAILGIVLLAANQGEDTLPIHTALWIESKKSVNWGLPIVFLIVRWNKINLNQVKKRWLHDWMIRSLH